MSISISEELPHLTTTQEERRCRCGALQSIVRKMMDPNTGRTVRMFECQCGQRSWTDAKE